jgi:hypothetical protein
MGPICTSITEFMTILTVHRKETVGKPKFRSLEPGTPPTGSKSGRVKREAEIPSLLNFFFYSSQCTIPLFSDQARNNKIAKGTKKLKQCYTVKRMVFRTLSKVLQIFLTVLDNICKPFLSLSHQRTTSNHSLSNTSFLPMVSFIIIAGTN